jgi:coenzyme PQQ biosynthesis protein PqqD
MKGTTASFRRTIRLAAGYQLQKAPGGPGHILVAPMGAIQLNESAAVILELCSGQYTSEEVIARALQRGKDSLADDVRSFLDAALRRGWLVEG